MEQKYGVSNQVCQTELKKLENEKIIYRTEYRGKTSYRIVGWSYNRDKTVKNDVQNVDCSPNMRDIICGILSSRKQGNSSKVSVTFKEIEKHVREIVRNEFSKHQLFSLLNLATETGQVRRIHKYLYTVDDFGENIQFSASKCGKIKRNSFNERDKIYTAPIKVRHGKTLVRQLTLFHSIINYSI